MLEKWSKAFKVIKFLIFRIRISGHLTSLPLSGYISECFESFRESPMWGTLCSNKNFAKHFEESFKLGKGFTNGFFLTYPRFKECTRVDLIVMLARSGENPPAHLFPRKKFFSCSVDKKK